MITSPNQAGGRLASVANALQGLSFGIHYRKAFTVQTPADHKRISCAGRFQRSRFWRGTDAAGCPVVVDPWRGWLANTEVGLAAGLRFVPVILISLYAGVMIDRFGAKRVFLIERWLLVALALVTALIFLSGSAEIWHIVTLSTIAGATIAIGMPAVRSFQRSCPANFVSKRT